MRAFLLFSVTIACALVGLELVHVLAAVSLVAHHGALPHGLAGIQVMTAGPALELLTGFVTAPSATLTAWTMASGNTLTVRNSDMTKRVSLLQMWGDWQTAGYLRVTSPKMHDNVQGIRLKGTASDAAPLLPFSQSQRLYPQDTLTVTQSGSATAGDIETGCLLLYYEDMQGVAARMISPTELLKRGVNIFPVENTLSLGTAGGYSGEEAINAEYDLFKANTDYALVGYLTDTECAAIRWRGADTGNLGVGGPGNETLRHVTSDWFIRLSDMFALPLIPVFNSASKQAILIDGAQDENGADPCVNSIFVELAPTGR